MLTTVDWEKFPSNYLPANFSHLIFVAEADQGKLNTDEFSVYLT